MNIDWSGIGEVFGIGLGATVVVVVLFSLGITALGRRVATTGEQRTTAAPLVLAVSCVLVCAAVVGYGLYLIVRR